MATFNRFEEIGAWQKARTLCNDINQVTLETELAKDYKLKDQINGSSGSIMDNIAEGFGRGGNPEFIQFLEISHASLVNANHSYTDYLIENIFLRINLTCFMIWLMKLEKCYYLLSAIYQNPNLKVPNINSGTNNEIIRELQFD